MIDGNIFFDPKDPLYLEHFPGNPVVPGSLVISGLYNESVKWELPVKTPMAIKDFKFKKFLKPGKYKYELNSEVSGVRCTIHKEGVIFATGVILWS